jgi:hypothetical protein
MPSWHPEVAGVMMMMFDIEPTRQIIMSSEETKPVVH